MKKNMGNTDRIIRTLIAVAIAVVYFATDLLPATLGLVLLVVAVVFAATSLVSFCPLYRLVGMNTCPAPKQR